MIESMRKTVRTAGVRGLFDGITGTWLRQMSYSLCRFWAYDESKKIVGAGKRARTAVQVPDRANSVADVRECRSERSCVEARVGGKYGYVRW